MEFTSSWLLPAWKQIILHSDNILSLRAGDCLGAAHQREGLTVDTSKRRKVGQETPKDLDEVQEPPQKTLRTCLVKQAWVIEVW